jgi:hypothetical protein
MQCASSTTSRLDGWRASSSTNAASASRSGVVKTIFALPRGDRASAAAISSAPTALLSCTAATPSLAQLVALVLHQRDQRRDDERRSRQQQRGSW